MRLDYYSPMGVKSLSTYPIRWDAKKKFLVGTSRTIDEIDIKKKEQNKMPKGKQIQARNGKDKVKSQPVHAPRSQARPSNVTTKLNQQQVPPNLVELPIVTMADNRTMAELLQAPTEGYEDAIVVPEIEAANFEIKHGLLTLVQNKQFFGNDKEDPHAHIPRIWLEKEPPRSIQTWDDLVAKFINQFFPPSKTTNLRNEITNFKQRFDESFSEAWDRFKDLLRALQTLNSPSDVSPDVLLNRKTWLEPLLSTSDKSPVPAPAPVKAVEQSCVTCGGAHHIEVRQPMAVTPKITSKNTSRKHCANFNQGKFRLPSATYANQIRHPVFHPLQHNNQSQQSKSLEPNQNRAMAITSQIQRPQFNTSPVYQPSVNQPPTYQAPAHQASGVSKTDFESYVNANDAVMQNMQNQMTNITDLLTKIVNSNQASTSSSGSLPSTTLLVNPRVN
ncbi:reverse transcriptase domain-containing protein [Tanacetum coccineum]